MKKYLKESLFVLSFCTAILAFDSACFATEFDSDDEGQTTVVSKGPRLPALTEDEIEAKKWLVYVIKTIGLFVWGK
jgi:hypothetical protein